MAPPAVAFASSHAVSHASSHWARIGNGDTVVSSETACRAGDYWAERDPSGTVIHFMACPGGVATVLRHHDAYALYRTEGRAHATLPEGRVYSHSSPMACPRGNYYTRMTADLVNSMIEPCQG